MNGFNGIVKPKHILIVLNPPAGDNANPAMAQGLVDMRRLLQVRGFDPVIWFWPISDEIKVFDLDRLQHGDMDIIKRLIAENLPKIKEEVSTPQ